MDQCQWPSRSKSAYQGGPFASVEREGDGWVVCWWVGPKGRYTAPSEAKAVAWVERFAEPRLARLGRFAASPGQCPYDARRAPEPVIPPEIQARYDAFIASYSPARAKKRRLR
jgi:hypothetical protein